MSLDRAQLPDPRSFYEDREGLALKGHGKWRSTECRFHGGTHSTRLNMETGAFVCMAACGARGGDIVGYYMAAHGVGFVQACKDLAAWRKDRQIQERPRKPRQC